MIHEIQEGYVKVEPKNGVTTIEFYHPQGNSLPSAILADLTQEIHSAGMDDDTRVIVLRSSGDGAFCGEHPSGSWLHYIQKKKGKNSLADLRMLSMPCVNARR